MEDYNTMDQPEECGAMKNKYSLSPMEMGVANVVLGKLETMAKLEERAKKLLGWKITGKGKTPNPFAQTETITEELQFLVDKGYVIQRGGTPKSLSYEVTPEGKRFALG